MLVSPTPPAFDIFRVVRSVSPPESPFDATVVDAADGRTVMLVDRSLVADLPGWGADEHTHLLAPLDVVRRADGHDVVVPLLSEGVERFLHRRREATAPITAGEAVTLGVSIARGLTASLASGRDGEGEWWLTDDGRPLLVEGVGTRTAREESVRLLEAMSDDLARTRLGAALHALAESARQPDFARSGDTGEDALFACVEPEPLMTEVFGPIRARRTPPALDQPEPTPPRSLWQRLAFHADADLAATASDLVHAAVRRIRRPRSARRPILVAAAIAVALVGVGVLWPTGDNEDAAAERAAPEVGADASGSASMSPMEQPSTAVSDIAVVTTELLDRRSACPDTACLTTVLEDPVRMLPPGVIDDPSPTRRATLLDDLGGVVVVRVDSLSSRATQIVTLVETKDGWRIRDVHDVTDAPS